MSDFLDRLEAAVRRGCVSRPDGKGVTTLEETAATSSCEPIELLGKRDFLVVRLGDNDYLGLLEPRGGDASLQKLPDALTFIDPPDPTAAACVLITEMKSSEAGVLAARRQILLGRHLAEYLGRLVWAQMKRPWKDFKLWAAGHVASPKLPPPLMPKPVLSGKKKPSWESKPEPEIEDGFHIHYTRDGITLHLASMFDEGA